jgi:hypothetical protein
MGNDQGPLPLKSLPSLGSSQFHLTDPERGRACGMPKVEIVTDGIDA